MKTYETVRLYLKPTQEEDASFILELLNMPKWLKYIGDRNVHSVEEAVAYIQERMLPQLERLGFGNYTVIRKSDGMKMGTCGLYQRDGLEGVDIGFAFLEAYEGQGYAFEAANKIKQLAFTDFQQAWINAITTKDNIASQKLLKKLGLHYVKMVTLPNDDEELLFYQLTKEDALR